MGEIIQAEIVKEEQPGAIGQLVVQADQALTVAIRSTRESMLARLEEAKAFTCETEADVEAATKMIVAIREECEPIIERIKPFKEEVSGELDRIRSIEKIFTTTVSKADQVKAMADPRFTAFQAILTLKTKMNNCLDEIERKKEEERRRIEEEARREQEKRLKAISAKLDKIQAEGKDKAEQKAFLEKYLEEDAETISDEEAAQVRARIETLTLELKGIESKVIEKQTQMEQVTTPVTVAMEQTKVAGLSSGKRWVAGQVVNSRLLLQAILDGKAPMGCVTFSLPVLSRYGNDQVKGMKGAQPTIPGVEFRQERDSRVR
jgi:hypothetical protein